MESGLIFNIGTNSFGVAGVVLWGKIYQQEEKRGSVSLLEACVLPHTVPLSVLLD